MDEHVLKHETSCPILEVFFTFQNMERTYFRNFFSQTVNNFELHNPQVDLEFS